jgi:SpoVK/Ycf46/Vps4 family AAA+-type ATPase
MLLHHLSIYIHVQDFLLALKKVSKSVGKGDLQKYDDWMKEFGSA